MRRGISLLEVLAAMLVLTIGILGMARLIPVGVYQLSQVYKLDGASTLGRASFRDLEVRGYLNPSMWSDPVLGMLIDSSTGAQRFNYYQPPTTPWTAAVDASHPQQFPQVVTIDPLFVGGNMTLDAAHIGYMQTFPYSPYTFTSLAKAPRIPRLSVFTNGSPTPHMQFALAQKIFMSSDERSYTKPSIDNQRPTMVFERDESKATRPALQSATLGSDSWFVTVAPAISESASPSTIRQYTASVVVCNKRDLTLPASATAVNSPVPGERMLVATVQANGIGGGDVLLTAPDVGLTDWLNVRPGQWIFLTCYVVAPGAPPTPMMFADWYRIVGVGELVSGSNPPSRYVTLHGADWALNAPVSGSTLQQILTAAGVTPQVFATIVDGVTGVYQKTITLDGSSSWSQ